MPVLFATSTGDTFINPKHSEELHEAHQGKKQLITFDGDHNSKRPIDFFQTAATFLHRAMDVQSHCPQDLKFTEQEMNSRRKLFRE